MGVIMPPTPMASPIIRLDTIDLPRGASFCAMTRPSGMQANRKKPASAAPA